MAYRHAPLLVTASVVRQSVDSSQSASLAMPPSSRGSNGAQRLSAHGQRRQHDVGRERQRKRQQQEERKRSATIWAQDPLTLIITLVSYPVLIVAFALLHVGYYVTLKAQASLRFQQTVVQHLRTQQRPFVQRIIRGSNATERGRPSIEQACNECAQARLAIMPTMAHQAQGLRKMAAKAAGDRVRVLPRHVALALGAKPVRTRTLLARLMLQPFRSSDRIDTASQPGTGGTGMTSEADREQRQFALANLRAMLRYCSLVSVAELTVFDENGYLSGLLEGQHRETFVEDFVLDAARRPTDSENDRRSISTTRIHIDAIFRRPFQAVAPNGVAVSEGPVSIDSCETRQIRVNVLGPNEARAALVRVMTIVQQRTQGKAQVVKVDDNMIQNVLTDHGYPSDPDLLLIHGGARRISTLQGFPPWLLRLCEIFHDVDATPHLPVTALSFERALDAYSRSEQRYGK